METKDVFIKISYKGRMVEKISYPDITSGSVDTVSVKFEFDEAWQGFTRRVIFVNGEVAIQILLGEDNVCEVPWEVLERPGDLFIGVVGQNGTEIMPSAKAAVHIIEGTITSGNEAKQPSRNIYDQMVEIMQETLSTAAELQKAAAEGKFDGENGEDGYTPKRGVDYFTPEDIATAIEELKKHFVPRSSASTAVYARVNGTDDMLEYAAESAKPLSVVRRNGGGRIITADPVTGLNAANKNYVDAQIEKLRQELGGIMP